MAQLGTLFATEGEVDKYFQHKTYTPHAFSISKDDLRSHGFPENPTKEQFVSYLDREIAMANNYLIDLNRVRSRVADHIRSAPEREATALQRWASGYCDGLDKALRIARHEDE